MIDLNEMVKDPEAYAAEMKAKRARAAADVIHRSEWMAKAAIGKPMTVKLDKNRSVMGVIVECTPVAHHTRCGVQAVFKATLQGPTGRRTEVTVRRIPR